ncbi:MAG: phospho-N-acetylmuramoyl-pentapeptide-transferase [Bacilli bacterium]
MSSFTLLSTVGIAFLIVVALSPFAIPYLRRLKFGQSIRDEGPKSHQKKSGTPTMGGIIILISVIVSAILTLLKMPSDWQMLALLLFLTVGYGLIGFVDDYIKVVKKRNLGLTSKQKFIAQLAVGVVFYAILHVLEVPTTIAVPFVADPIDLAWFYPVLVIIMLVGTSNATNLTDGLDGLLSGTAAIAFGAFAYIAYDQNQMSVMIFCLAVVGALLGFLVFNANPAKIFMGDTGSLALGAMLCGVSILTKQELLLVLIGGIFVVETLSVIIQVASFKTTGKRVFRMSPLHHHYELLGWSEWRIVTTFWSVGLLCSLLAIYLTV